MPWCDDCSKFWAPTAMNADGSCPTCGRVLEKIERPGTAAAVGDGGAEDEEDAKTPWHFYVLVVAVVAYLGWRLVQFVIWAI